MSIDYRQEMTAINLEAQSQQTPPEHWAAHYYPFHENDSLLASLTVLLDDEVRVLQAELAFYDNPPDAKRNPVLRQAKNIVARAYNGAAELTTINILESHSQSTAQVRHSGQPVHTPPSNYRLLPIAAAIGIVCLVILLVVLAVAVARNQPTPTVAQLPTLPAAAPNSAESSGSVAPTATTAGETVMQSSDGQTYTAVTNGLAPSVNADARLAPGDNARIRAGLAAYLRSEPGPTAGAELVVMQDGDVGRIIGGPVWLPGETDTIVWWYLELEDSGVKGWVSANTSELMVLEQTR